MEVSTQERAIKGLVDLWEDICFVQGKGFIARQLKLHIQKALKEPGSAIHRLFEATPGKAEWYISYGKKPKGLRRRIIGQNLTRKAVQELTWLFKRGIYNLAIAYRSEGITAAEAERRINRQYRDALSTITLKELVKADDNATYKNEVHNLMARLGLTTGSLAGADKRLKIVLAERFRTLTGKTPLYELDLKEAMWECATGNGHLLYETLKVIEGDPPRPLEEQISLIVRIFKGQEQKLMRGTLLRILRKTIADLPEISDELRQKHRAYKRGKAIEAEELRLERVSAVKDTLMTPLKHVEGFVDGIEEPAVSPADLLERIGITKENTSPADWETLMLISRKVLDGELESGSKTGLSISAAFGSDAARVRKTISRYRERQPRR